MNHRDILHRLK